MCYKRTMLTFSIMFMVSTAHGVLAEAKIVPIATEAPTAEYETSAFMSEALSEVTFPLEPMATSVSVEPNILFILDNSSAMNQVLPEKPYDSSVTYASCPEKYVADPDERVDVRIYAKGYAYFKSGLLDYEWGVGTSNGKLGLPIKCFNSKARYHANLYGELGDEMDTKMSKEAPGAVYSGNYLNWYFGSDPTYWEYAARKKPGVNTRFSAAKTVLKSLFGSLNNVRVGLATLDNVSGANIRVGVAEVISNRSLMLDELEKLEASGDAPLGGALQGAVRYFAEGPSGNITLHPESDSPQTVSLSTALNNTVKYSSGVSKSSPTQAWCQKSFVIMLTAGEASADTEVSSTIRDYAVDDPISSTFYLDDVAKVAFDSDLRPDLTDDNGHIYRNNLVLYTIGFSDPSSVNTKLLMNAAHNGSGKFMNAKSSEKLVTVIAEAANDVLSNKGTSSAATVNSGNISADSALFATSYSTSDWSGSLLRQTIDSNGNLASVQWDVSSKLDSVDPRTRLMLTYNKDTNQGVSFESIKYLSADQLADLNTGFKGEDGNAEKRLQYLRGDNSLEKTYFRARTHLLGDIVHSSPAYVGDPVNTWPDIAPFPSMASSKYSAFRAAHLGRKKMIYVGSNDGMLHGFNAEKDGGQELLAYIPALLSSSSAKAGLHYLTDPNYQHRYYVDASATVSDAYFKSRTDTTAKWHTVLVSGLRSGGRGIFALDVTDASKFSAANANKTVLWEFSSKDDSGLGYSFGRPVIGMLNNGRWAAIFGNGYGTQSTHSAKLFIVYLDGGHKGSWVKGVDYEVIETHSTTATAANGLSSPTAVDLNGDHVIDRVYAGDLQGHMWAFDLSANRAAGWQVAYSDTDGSVPLFTATEAGHNQPITVAPVIVRHTGVASSAMNGPNLMVYFGTGQFIFDEDKTSVTPESFYGIHDEGVGNLTSANLVSQSIMTSGSARVLSSNAVHYEPVAATDGKSSTAKQYGWNIHLTSGERVTAAAKLRDNILHFNTIIPNFSTTCSHGGTGWLMAVDMLTGGTPDHNVYDVNNDNEINDKDKVSNTYVSGIAVTQGMPAESAFKGSSQFTATSTTQVQVEKLAKTSLKVGRISWRELFKY